VPLICVIDPIIQFDYEIATPAENLRSPSGSLPSRGRACENFLYVFKSSCSVIMKIRSAATGRTSRGCVIHDVLDGNS